MGILGGTSGATQEDFEAWGNWLTGAETTMTTATVQMVTSKWRRMKGGGADLRPDAVATQQAER